MLVKSIGRETELWEGTYSCPELSEDHKTIEHRSDVGGWDFVVARGGSSGWGRSNYAIQKRDIFAETPETLDFL
jgi:hypothetical protein